MENYMTYLALFISIIGLLILTFASEGLVPPISKIEQIDANSLGRNIHIRGNISSVYKFNGGSVLLVVNDGTGEIDVYLPYRVSQDLKDFIINTSIDVIGEVEIYKGKLEIVVSNSDNIKKIR